LKLLKMKFTQKTLSSVTIEKLHVYINDAVQFIISKKSKKTSNKFTGDLLSQCIMFYIRLLKHVRPDDVITALDEERVTSLYCDVIVSLFTERKANNSASLREVLTNYFERFPKMSVGLLDELLKHHKNTTHQASFNQLLHTWLRSCKSMEDIPTSNYHDILSVLSDLLSSQGDLVGQTTINQAKTSPSNVYVTTRLCCEQIMKRDEFKDDVKTNLSLILKKQLKVEQVKRSSKLTNLVKSILNTIKAEWTEEELNEIKKEKEEAKLASIENQKKKQQKKAEKRAQAKKRKAAESGVEESSTNETSEEKTTTAVPTPATKKNYGKKTKKFDMKKSGKFVKKRSAA